MFATAGSVQTAVEFTSVLYDSISYGKRRSENLLLLAVNTCKGSVESYKILLEVATCKGSDTSFKTLLLAVTTCKGVQRATKYYYY